MEWLVCKCGRHNPEDSKFCTSCGAALSSDEGQAEEATPRRKQAPTWKRLLVFGVAGLLVLNVALCSVGLLVSEPETPPSSGKTAYVPGMNTWVPGTPNPTATRVRIVVPTPNALMSTPVRIPPTPKPAPTAVARLSPTPRPAPQADPYRQEAKVLWNELQKMRADPEFLRCGYGAGCGPGAAWQRRVKNLNEQGGRRLFEQYGFVVTDLLSIGMDYMEHRPGDVRLEARVKKGLGLR